MPFLKALSFGITTGLVATGTFFYAISQVEAVQLSPSDSLLKSKYHEKYNPNHNLPVKDFFIRRVPISQIDPSLLRNQECLIERYTAGVWAGAAFVLQRTLLGLFSQKLPHELWTPTALLSSNYEPGTISTNELVVLSKSRDAIIIRGGDKISKAELRPMDALIELSVQTKGKEYVEFGFKSLFFQGIEKADTLPMPGFVVWLHEVYARALLESGVRFVLSNSKCG